jgi:hypothetical protein
MNYKIIIFISILFALASCRPFTTTLSSSKDKKVTENETEETVVESKKKDYYRIPSGPIDDETTAETSKKKENFLIPSGPMDTEELLIAQAKSAAKEQALKRAEMARKRKAAEAIKSEDGITATTGADIPRIDQLEDNQAKDAAKELLAKRAAMERAKRMEATKIKEREERLANIESSEELKRINELKLAEEKEKEAARLFALQKEQLEKEKEAARLLALQKEQLEKEKEAARLLALQKEKEAARLLALQKEQLEKEKEAARLLALQKEQLEKEKMEAAIAAAKTKELERLELERLERERLEAKRIAQENAEREIRNAAAIAAAKTEEERKEKERIAKEEVAIATAKAETERLERERIAKEEIAILNAKAEADRLERERIAKEEAAIAEAKAKADRLEKERIAKEEAAIAEAKAKADRLEKERIAKEEAAIAEAKAKADRLEKERIAKEEAAIAEAKAKTDRLERERIAAEKEKADNLEKERIATAKEDARKKAAELATAKQAEMKAEEERKKNLAKTATNTETIINEDAKTVATKEDNETEKEKAARYARQNLELQKEGDKKAGWLLSKKEKEERKTFDNKPENTVANEEAIAPRETTPQPERMLKQANIPISIADMDSDPALNKINAVPSPTLKKYYFPIQTLETAKAYCFVSGGSTIDTTYWLMKSLSFGGKSYLITEKYDHSFVMTSSSRERINELGAYVEDYTAYESSGLGGSIAVEYWVEDDEGFKWNMDNGVFAMVSMNFNSSDFPNYDITAYRERHLINSNATYIFKGKTLPAVVLEDRQTTVYVDNKSNEESYPSSYENYFAEGIGLVKFTINKRDKGFTLARTYTLSHIIPYEDWQRITK